MGSSVQIDRSFVAACKSLLFPFLLREVYDVERHLPDYGSMIRHGIDGGAVGEIPLLATTVIGVPPPANN